VNEDRTTRVNGVELPLTGDPGTPLVDVLRDEMSVRSVHVGCRNGDCGACTVLLDGEPVKSCLVPCHRAAGKDVVTLAGLAPAGSLHPVARAFWETNGFQCGFCLPGMVLCTVALAEGDGSRDEVAIREALAGNLCRCTGYQNVLVAAERALAETSDGGV